MSVKCNKAKYNKRRYACISPTLIFPLNSSLLKYIHCLLYIFTLMANLQLKLNMPQRKLFMICLSKLGPPAFPISVNYKFSSHFLRPINLAAIFDSTLSFLSSNKSINESCWLDHKNIYRISPCLSMSTATTLS